jgi:hypothetical protein
MPADRLAFRKRVGEDAEIRAMKREADEGKEVEVFQTFTAYNEASQIQPLPEDIFLRLH